MKIYPIHLYNICVDEQEFYLQFNSTKKKLEEYITEDKEVDGVFRPNRMLDKIVKDGYFFRFVRI